MSYSTTSHSLERRYEMLEDMLTSRDKQNIRNNQRNKRNAGERGEAVSYVSKEDNRTSDVTTTEPYTKQSLSTAVTTSLTDTHL